MRDHALVTFRDLAESHEFAEFFTIVWELTGTVIALSAPQWTEAKRTFPPEMMAPICRVILSTPEGEAACIRSNIEHTEEALRKGKPTRYVCHAGLVDFMVPICVRGHHIATIEGGQLLRETPNEKGFKNLLARTKSYNLDRTRLRSAYFETRPAPEQKISAIVALVSLFAQRFSEFAWQMRGLKEDRRHPAVTKAIEHIKQHHHQSERVTLKNVANAARLSPSYLSALFSKTVGITFTTYVQRTRIARAKALLRKTKKTVSEIAFDVGFQNITHFNYVFRKLEADSPTGYRTAMKSRADGEKSVTAQ